jgi:ankyrin repeat protein
VLELLASHGADMGAATKFGRSPLFFAAVYGRLGMMSFLLSLPAVCDTLHHRDRSDKTAEEFVRSCGKHAIADVIAEAVRCCFFRYC